MNRYSGTGTWKGILFIAALVFIFCYLLYTQGTVARLRAEANSLARINANLIAKALSEEGPENLELSLIFNEVIEKIRFPVIVTDEKGIPRAWKNVGITPSASYPEGDDSAIPKLREIVERMDRRNRPIFFQAHEALKGYVHYGDPEVISWVAWLPFVEIGAIVLFIFLGFIGFSQIKKNEQRFIWIGMAKETAHQLGTPLSSLSGWIELIKMELVGDGHGVERRKHARKFDRITREMESDIKRLNRIASRFSLIGSTPELKLGDVNEVLRETVDYFQDRLPHFGREIRIEEHYGDVPEILMNRELLGWSFENLIRNSIDAIETGAGEGRIKVTSLYANGCVRISFEDNGRGMSQKEQRRVFSPGYSTKPRGWGLGLNFVKRIVEDYHKGKVYLKSSYPGVGTVMEVSIPVQRGPVRSLPGRLRDLLLGLRRRRSERDTMRTPAMGRSSVR